MRAMLEHAHDAVVSMDGEGRVSQWNRAAERLFGWTPIEAMGQPVAELIVPPTLRGEFARIVAGFAASERLEDAHQRVAVPAVDRAGRELSVEVSLTATRVDGRWELTAFGHDVSERKHLEQQLRALALCDGLTGLANRRAFMEALEKAVARSMRFGHPRALLFMDMDGFKEINDCFGHHVGDLALQAFARRLERCVRKGDTIARLGGDEFTVLAEGVDSLAQAEAIARKIVEAMVPPMESTGVRLRTSIGISLYRAPADASQFFCAGPITRCTRPSGGSRGATANRRTSWSRNCSTESGIAAPSHNRVTATSPGDPGDRSGTLTITRIAGDPPWKHDGVRVVPADRLDPNTAQTPGMDRQAAITFARTGAQKLWAGTVHIHPNAKTGAHHHGPLESVIYVVKGRARMRWGERLEFTAEAGPGDFIYVPPFVPHQEINASATEVLECVLVRSDGQAVAVNLDIEPAEPPEDVPWIDPTHPDFDKGRSHRRPEPAVAQPPRHGDPAPTGSRAETPARETRGGPRGRCPGTSRRGGPA